MTITLIYPSFYADKPHVAELDAEVRLTPTEIVLVRPLMPIRYVNGHEHGPTGIGNDERWHRRNGRKVGYAESRGWRPSKASLAMIRDTDKAVQRQE